MSAEEMSAKELELMREIVSTLASNTCGTMMVSRDKFEILVLRDQQPDIQSITGRVFDMILEISGSSDKGEKRKTEPGLDKREGS